MSHQLSFQGIDAVYKTKADNKDIRDLLEGLVPKAKLQMKDFAQKFKGASDEKTCENIFNYIKSNFTFIADGNEQIIKLPSALLKKRVGDCKSFSLFTASILENLNIPYKFVYASYNSNPIPQHVYVVTEKGCIIDVVYGTFNKEKKAIYKYLKNMNVRYMAGLGTHEDYAMGLSGKQERQQKRQDRKENQPNKVALVGLSGGRALVLSMIKSNLDGMATKMSKLSDANLKNYWGKAGGNFTKLQDAIKKGASKPQKKLGFLPRLKKLFAKKGIKGITGTQDEEVKAAILAASTAIGAAIAPATGAVAGASVGSVLVMMYPMVVEMVKATPPTSDDTITPNPNVENEATDDGATTTTTQSASAGGFDIKKYLPFIAIGGAVGLYLLLSKKK